MAGIPGLDVTEVFNIDPDNQRVKTQARARLAAGQAQAAEEAARVAAQGAAPPPPSQGMRGAIGRTLVSGAAPVAAGIAGSVLNRAADRAFAPSGGIGNTAYPDGNNVAPGQIPGQAPGVVAPKAMESSFFRDTETGRNIGNIINAIPGAASVPNTLLRAGSTAQRAAELGGTALRSAALDNAISGQPTTPAIQSSVSTPAPAGSAASIRQPFSDARFESQRQGGDPQSPGTVTVGPGNSFSGTNIRQGFNYSDGRQGTGTVSSLDTSAGAAADRAILARNAAERAATASAPQGGLTGANMGYGLMDPTRLARRELDMAVKDSKGGMESGSGYNQRIAGAAQGLREFDQAQQQLPVEVMRNNTLREQNRTNNETLRRNNDQNNFTVQRGQDREVDERRIQANSAAAAGARAQANSDRQYQLDVAKYGTEVAEKNRTAGAAAQKANQERLENTFRTTDDKGNSVPDQNKIASYNAAIDTTLPQLTKALLATGKPEAIAKAKLLNERGAAALDPNDQAQLMQLFQTREQLRSTRSAFPGGAEFSDSNDLLQFRQAPGAAGIDKRMLTPNRIQFQGGSSATPNDLSIRGGANMLLPDIGATRTDDLLRGLRRE